MSETPRPLSPTPTQPPLSTGDRIYFVVGFGWIALLLTVIGVMVVKAGAPWDMAKVNHGIQIILIFFVVPIGGWWLLDKVTEVLEIRADWRTTLLVLRLRRQRRREQAQRDLEVQWEQEWEGIRRREAERTRQQSPPW